ncbi:MAG: WxcM-like domain-containing protein [Thermodesulfovibrionales bacterium]|nr:WxcM-like domain-containing protein [Thermodesulfovibrionales bacterium]
MERNLLEELDDKAFPIYKDERGKIGDFRSSPVEGLHVVEMKPGAVRGNHVHDKDEIICIISGSGICEIIVEDEASGKRENVVVKEDMISYKIVAGAKHIIRNIGKDVFYLVCFMVA